MGLHNAVAQVVPRYYEAHCPWCNDKMSLDDNETFTDGYSGETFHMECWDQMQFEAEEGADFDDEP